MWPVLTPLRLEAAQALRAEHRAEREPRRVPTRSQAEAARLLGVQPVAGRQRDHAGQRRPAVAEQGAGHRQRLGARAGDVGQVAVDLACLVDRQGSLPLEEHGPTYGGSHAVLGGTDPGSDACDGRGRHRLGG